MELGTLGCELQGDEKQNPMRLVCDPDLDSETSGHQPTPPADEAFDETTVQHADQRDAFWEPLDNQRDCRRAARMPPGLND